MNQRKYWVYLKKLKRGKRKNAICPICQKSILEFYYKHVEQCLKMVELRNRMYNEDVVILERKIECVICLENMDQGQIIARLECLCIYHKPCIDLWLDKKMWCPSHPPQ